jgi:YesN/AraC family two-component response regulator
MVSSHSQKEMVVEAISKGAKHYILKPIRKEMLVQVLEKIT